MRKLSQLLFMLILVIVSCKQEKKVIKDVKGVENIVSKKTYAEISIKEGGKWQGKKYIGNNVIFKNVTYLKAPDSLTDHSYYIRYEGPGWESSRVGYRLYFDWRNAIDIFGKKVDSLVLSRVGLDNYDSYHENSSWGQDILKVGNSLGIGSYGRFDGDKTVIHFKQVDSTKVQIHNTEDASGITLNYFGWNALNQKIDLNVYLSIVPESRLTSTLLTPSMEIKGLSSGIVKFKGIEPIQKKGENGWAYLATYGKQTLVPDNLGMVIFYKIDQVEKVAESEYDHLIVFKPSTTPINYHFGAAWEQEKEGIKTKKEFISYLDATLANLN